MQARGGERVLETHVKDCCSTQPIFNDYHCGRYGRSRPPNRDFPVDFYQRDADDAAGLMEALGYDQYTVMGWSDGAMSAVLLAAAYSSRVERLIIFGGNAFLTNEDIDAFEATRDVAKTWSTRMRETHEPVYGKVGLQTLWSSAVDVSLARATADAPRLPPSHCVAGGLLAFRRGATSTNRMMGKFASTKRARSNVRLW